jgi:uncharacterized protein YndB with AHSA1/START domain
MTVLSFTKDAANLTLTVIAEFAATPDRVWDVWQDPRKLERWWGPPTYPATFTRHDFVVGGESRYFMTGPGGHQPHGWWRIDGLQELRQLNFANGLAGDDGEPVPGIEPMAEQVTFEELEGGTRMTIVTQFIDLAQMEAMLMRGMQEGMTQAVGQIDGLLVTTAMGAGS